jgi:hypothetical protein
MNARQQQLCNWCGVVFVVVYTIGFWPLARFLPPMTPGMSPSAVASFFQQDTNQIRLGLVLMLGATGLMMPFFAVIADQMKTIPGCTSSLVYTQLGCGAISNMLVLMPPLLFTVTAFRPDRDINLIFLLYDLSWTVLVMPFSAATVGIFAIAIAIFSDKRAEPTFPRWAAYLNVWVGILLIPAGALTFFKVGPFAWDGLFAFWIPFAIYFVWMFAMFILMRKSIKRQQQNISGHAVA